MPDFAGDLLGFLTRCARDYGDIVRLRLGTNSAVLLNHPDQIEQVLVTRQADFVKYRFFWRHVTRLFGNGLLTSSGSLWRRQHALMAPAFRQDQLALSVDKIVCCAKRLFDHWQDGEERDIRADMTRLTIEIASKVLFDVELDCAVAGISRAVDRGIEEISKRFKREIFIPDWIPTPGNRSYLRLSETSMRLWRTYSRSDGLLVGIGRTCSRRCCTVEMPGGVQWTLDCFVMSWSRCSLQDTRQRRWR